MKLAEALQERADLNRKIDQLKYRMETNALVQEGESPSEDPYELKKELDEAAARLEELITAINLTNAKTVTEGKTLTAWISHRDVLTRQIAVYNDLIDTASRTAQRATRSEIRILSAVDVKQLRKETDALSAELRRTDALIQAANWTIDL